MNIEQLKERVSELESALSQSMANHNALAGRLSEARFFLEEVLKNDKAIIELQEC